MTPTVITDSFDVMCAAADAVATAISLNQQPLSSSIVGIHFEGPGLSQPKRGIHPTQHIRNIHNNELELFLRKDIGQVNVTVAPESCSPDLIKMLVANGVIVSLGHTNCDADTALRAIEAGATGATHIYNAMSGLTAREPGVIGTVLTSPSVYAGLIADMHHVHPTSCKLAFIAKGASRIMLVTDAMAHAGSDLQSLNWHEYQISKQGDKLTLADGTLAGSCLTMIDAVKLAVTNAGISLADALCSASQTPARFLNLTQHGTLEPGNYANFVVLSEDLSIESVWLHGVRY
jgi:N-acetylglucosamine-6-phosphate deacetylase